MAVLEVFLLFLRLGLTSFGGPIAHLGFFHDEFVSRRKWITEHAYADLVALCQFLPGPASSQVGMALGLSRAGYFGAIVAWLGFTLPSAIILVLVGLGISSLAEFLSSGVLHGLKISAVAVVAQALWLMAKKLCPDRARATLAISATIIAVVFSSALGQVSAIIVGGVFGWLFLKDAVDLPHEPLHIKMRRATGGAVLTVFFVLLSVLPFLVSLYHNHAIQIFESFFRAGSLVFGGGHVVLPLLQAEVVIPGWVSADSFMTGYGIAQAIPGPLFAFSAYLGAVSKVEPAGWIGASIALVAAFLPSFLLIIGILPFWERLRTIRFVRCALMGINAAVVGLLLAAFYDPVWTSAIAHIADFLVAALAFLLLTMWNVPSWAIVALCAFAGYFI